MPKRAAASPIAAGSTGRPAGGSSSAGATSATARTKPSKPAGVAIDQPARLVGLDAIGVRHVPRGQRGLAAAEHDVLGADDGRPRPR